MTSFSELGVPFPLFDAAVEETDWVAEGTCVVCRTESGGFHLGAGAYLAASCLSCDRPVFAPADGRSDDCIFCGSPVTVDPDGSGTASVGCIACLRSGLWAVTHDTEAGMVTPNLALRGRTHGVPTASSPSPEVVTPISFVLGSKKKTAGTEAPPTGGMELIAGWPALPPNRDGWQQAVIPAPVLLTLVRTPVYSTWQGSNWLFHCERAMIHIGRWTEADFNTAAPNGDGQALAQQVAGIDADWWPSVADRSGEPSINTYMFRCQTCDMVRGHWDMD